MDAAGAGAGDGLFLGAGEALGVERRPLRLVLALRLAQAEWLQVILRPGPYVCGEYDPGGMPWWLLKDRNMRLRKSYPGFLNRVRRYFKALGEQLAPLQATRGGLIVMVQVENEGSHGPWGDELRIDRRGELPAVSYGAEELRLRRTDR